VKKLTYIIIILLVSISPSYVLAQDITATERSEIINNVIEQMANRYVDPNLGKIAADTIKQKEKQQAYDNLNQKVKLLKALIADMHKITKDKHLQLVDTKGISEGTGQDKMQRNIQIFTPNPTSKEALNQNKLIQEMFKRSNYGLKNAKVIEGKIGYLDIRQFVSPGMAPDVYKEIDNTMKSFKDCSAIILDLSWCTAGGDPETTMYIASYFFSRDKPVLLYELYDRESKKIDTFHTRTDVTGKCMPGIPLYILVSAKTFSAGEMFAYGLQKIGRAKIIGQTTAGAAHSTDTIPIGRDTMMVIPVNRLAHVKTKSNWQGTGVTPDISVKSDDDILTVAKDIIQKAGRNDK
jgi:hypothetical protein